MPKKRVVIEIPKEKEKLYREFRSMLVFQDDTLADWFIDMVEEWLVLIKEDMKEKTK